MTNQALIKFAREAAEKAAYRKCFSGFGRYEDVDRARNACKAFRADVIRAIENFGYVEDAADRKEFATLKQALEDLAGAITIYDLAAANLTPA